MTNVCGSFLLAMRAELEPSNIGGFFFFFMTLEKRTYGKGKQIVNSRVCFPLIWWRSYRPEVEEFRW